MFYHGRMRVEYREEPCKVALNRVKGMPFDWSLNPYMGCAHRCTFCYVRAFERRADRPADDRYGRSIRVKVNIADRLRAELARRSWRCEPIAIGAATDPYQPAEGRYGLTRRCIEVLRDAANPFHVITRGPLIVRDAHLLAEASARAEVSVTFSVPTVDEDVWRTTEPGTSPPRQRLRALRVLVDAGVRASVGMAPLLPGLSDHPDSLERVVVAAREAGACGIWANFLYLRPGTREHFLECLTRDWPELLPEYERLYARGAYVANADSRPAKDEVRRLSNVHGVRDRRTVKPRPQARAEQLSLLPGA
jgi:DNA repair photolyase